MTERFRKNIPFTAVVDDRSTPLSKGVNFTLDNNGGSRRLYGPAGARLHRALMDGTLVYSPKKIAWGRERVLAMRAPEGIVILVFEAFGSLPVAGYISMCNRYAKKLGFARQTQRRWYRVVRKAAS